MADIFISYSRRDRDFVRKFHDALAKLNREAWIDWEDIPPTAEWLNEIYAGIEGTDNFVFVISPESISSATCQKEIAHASANNKRLIPILHRAVPDHDVPEVLGKINWIFFREADNFESAFASLIEALDTDLNWKRAHTRLLVRAKEWDREAKDGSFLLRGKDLEEAEQWVVQGAEKEPKPTALQTQYVVAGRRAATRRQRITLGAVTLALAVALILAVVAWTQRNTARQETRIANSRRLAATALLNKDDHLDLASLLSIEARNIVDTLEARDALFTTFELNPSFRIYLHHPAGVQAVAFSRDGKLLASACDDGYVRIWDAASGRLLGAPLRGHRDVVSSVSFSPDGRALASGSYDHRVLIWDVASRKAISEVVLGKKGLIHSVAFSEDGKLLAASMNDAVLVWHMPSGTPVGGPLRMPSERGFEVDIYSVALSPDGKLVAAAGTEHSVWLWDLERGQNSGVSLTGHTEAVLSVAFSPDGKLLASGSGDATIRLWSVADRRPLRDPLRGHDGSVSSVAFSPDGNLLASASGDQTMRLWEVSSGRQLSEPLRGHAGIVHDVAFDPEGGTIASAGIDHTVRLWDVAGAHRLQRVLTGHKGIVRGLAFSPDGRILASASDDDIIRLWDVVSGQPLSGPLTGHTGPVVTVAFSPDGSTLTSASLDQSLRRWDVPNRRALGEILRQQGGFALGMAVSLDGRFVAAVVAVADGIVVLLWDTVKRTQVSLQGDSAVAFSPDSKVLASGSADGTVRLWDVESHRLLGRPLYAHQDAVQALAFSHDGKMLASGGADQTVRVWDVARREPLGEPLRGHGGPITSVAFSPNGKILASAGTDAPVRLWDLDGSQFFGEPLRGHAGAVWSLAFSPDGKTLASGGGDWTVRLWNLDEDAWSSRGCERANRNLSLAEWRHYIGADIAYHRTCPDLPSDGSPEPNKLSR
jgi:WD40 repeat protein